MQRKSSQLKPVSAENPAAKSRPKNARKIENSEEKTLTVIENTLTLFENEPELVKQSSNDIRKQAKEILSAKQKSRREIRPLVPIKKDQNSEHDSKNSRNSSDFSGDDLEKKKVDFRETPLESQGQDNQHNQQNTKQILNNLRRQYAELKGQQSSKGQKIGSKIDSFPAENPRSPEQPIASQLSKTKVERI